MLYGLCGIAFKSRDLNHNPLVTSTGSSICKVFLRFDLVTYFLTRYDSFSYSFKISSRQKF